MLKVLSSILCDLDPKVKAIGQKAGICDGVPSTSALVSIELVVYTSGYYKFAIFRENLFSRIALKDIFVTLNIRDYGLIYLHQ